MDVIAHASIRIAAFGAMALVAAPAAAESARAGLSVRAVVVPVCAVSMNDDLHVSCSRGSRWTASSDSSRARGSGALTGATSPAVGSKTTQEADVRYTTISF